MTILQHDVNNHIPDGAHFDWWPSVLPDSKSVSLLSKGLLNLEPPLCSSGYAPGVKVFITSFMRVAYPLKYPSNACLSCLDNGPLLLECNLFRVSKCHMCFTSKQVSYQ